MTTLQNELPLSQQQLSVNLTIPIPADSIIISKVEYEKLQSQVANETKSKKEWMSLKEAALYIGVSYNTLKKLQIRGLKVCEIEGVKKISKTEIDSFLEKYSL